MKTPPYKTKLEVRFRTGVQDPRQPACAIVRPRGEIKQATGGWGGGLRQGYFVALYNMLQYLYSI